MPIFPDVVQRYLDTRYGPADGIDALGGLSQAQVWRVRLMGHSVIVKTTASRNEALFYQHVAPAVLSAGLAIPQLDWSIERAAMTWLILEDIPIRFPETRWLADAEQLAWLRALHQITTPVADLGDYRSAWSSSITDAALAWFAEPVAAALRPSLDRLREAAQPLFTPACLISGDPNPNNWGLRQDGTLVLFDWDRFSRATPAIDVAITLPGLPDRAAIELAAARYLDTREAEAVDTFARELSVAKVWSVVEFLSICRDRQVPSNAMLARLCALFPVWLDQLAMPSAH